MTKAEYIQELEIQQQHADSLEEWAELEALIEELKDSKE